jgi:hypothetical protein
MVCAVTGQVSFQSSSLPILVITTDGGAPIYDEPKTAAHLGIIWNGDGAVNSTGDPFNHFDGKIGIEIRGSSSQGFPKKNYAFETQNPDGSALNVSLLDFPKENDWVLYGPYSDKSLMRNALAYIMASWMMEYAPRVRFCEVVLNGDYIGLYMVTEKIKRDKNRVDISEINPNESEGDNLTGGYILKFDKWDGGFSDGFPSNYLPFPGASGQTVFQYHYPKADEITSPQKAYIESFVDELEASLKSENFKDPSSGYRKYFDMPSFFQFLFIQEISRNVDGYRLSTFMHKDKDSKNPKLKMGPVWDFNLGFGNVDYCIGPGTSGWALSFNDFCPGDYWVVHFWWNRMWADSAFLKEMKTRWQDLREDTLSDQRIFHLVDSLKSLLETPASRNFQRWPILSQYVWPNAFVGNSYGEEMNYLRNWLKNRLAWLDGAMDGLDAPVYDPGKYFPPEVFPNPLKDQVTFRYYAKSWEKVKIELFNSLGQLVAEATDDSHPSGESQWTLPAPPAKGLFFYRVWIGKKKASEGKLVRG